VSFAEPAEKTLTGIFQSASEDGSSFQLLFTHPATEEKKLIEFSITNQTGFSGLESAMELTEGDVLQVDYIELDGEVYLSRRVARVQMSGAPKGLENFNPQDLFRK